MEAYEEGLSSESEKIKRATELFVATAIIVPPNEHTNTTFSLTAVTEFNNEFNNNENFN